jgi:protein involved in polysaccharide export with SLBB domain
MKIHCSICAAFLLTLTCCPRTLAAVEGAAPAPPVNSARLDNRQRLGAGDRISYRVLEDQDETKSLTINDSGDLLVPYLGLVRAAGKTSLELSREIKGLLEKDLYRRATVIIAVEVVNKTRMLGKVYVTGQVRNSGGFDIPADETFTVSKAILKAGGFVDFSDKRNVRLVRSSSQGKRTFTISVTEIWEKGKTENDPVLQPGDLIVVPARLVNF